MIKTTLLTMSLLSVFTATDAHAYNPDSKLECRKRLSAEQFLYFEVQPLSLKGHPFELDLFENDQLVYQKKALLGASNQDQLLKFNDTTIAISVKENEDYHSQLKIMNDPTIKTTIDADCSYFVPISDFQ